MMPDCDLFPDSPRDRSGASARQALSAASPATSRGVPLPGPYDHLGAFAALALRPGHEVG